MDLEEVDRLVGSEVTSAPLFDLGEVSWRPTYGNEDGRLAVYVTETPVLGDSIQRRVSAAIEAGIRVVVCLPDGPHLLEPDSQLFLLDSHVEVMTPGSDGLALVGSFVEVVYSAGLLFDPNDVAPVIARLLQQAASAPKAAKGVALEQAIALGMSQVPGFKVHSTNLRTDNEELDVVVMNSSSRAPLNGSPIVLVECKNWTSSVERVEYDAFHMKMKERGGLAKVGFMIAAEGFSSGFYQRANSFGTQDVSVIPITVPWLCKRLLAGDPMETVLGRRVLEVAVDRRWEEAPD